MTFFSVRFVFQERISGNFPFMPSILAFFNGSKSSADWGLYFRIHSPYACVIRWCSWASPQLFTVLAALMCLLVLLVFASRSRRSREWRRFRRSRGVCRFQRKHFLSRTRAVSSSSFSCIPFFSIECCARLVHCCLSMTLADRTALSRSWS